MLRKKYTDFTITPQHLGVVIRDQNITRKWTTRRHFPKTRYGKKFNLKELNTKFYKEVDKYDLSKIVCLDEISVSVQMKPNYSRCELGKRCVQKTTNNNVFKKYTLIIFWRWSHNEYIKLQPRKFAYIRLLNKHY